MRSVDSDGSLWTWVSLLSLFAAGSEDTWSSSVSFGSDLSELSLYSLLTTLSALSLLSLGSILSVATGLSESS